MSSNNSFHRGQRTRLSLPVFLSAGSALTPPLEEAGRLAVIVECPHPYELIRIRHVPLTYPLARRAQAR